MKKKRKKKAKERGKEKKEKTAQKRRSHIASLSATSSRVVSDAGRLLLLLLFGTVDDVFFLSRACFVSFSSTFFAASVRRGVLSRACASLSVVRTVPLNGQKERDEKMEHRNHHHHGPTTRRQALGEINGNTARENTNAGKNALATKRGYVFRSRFEILLYSR